MVQKPKEILPRARELFHLLNTCYDKLYGFVPLTEKQIDTYIKQYFGFIRPGHVCLIFDSEDRLAAFGITMPSLSRAFQRAKGKLFPFGFAHILRGLYEAETVDFYLVAVRPDLQGKGVPALMFSAYHELLTRRGFGYCESNPELEGNEDIQGQWKYFDPRQHKRRRCFIKEL
jgi:GNAT superfamily N-acetyltransferase